MRNADDRIFTGINDLQIKAMAEYCSFHADGVYRFVATAAVDCQQSGVAYADVPESLDLALITMQQDQVVLCTPLSPRPEFVLAGGKAGLIEAILGNVTIEGEIIENQTLTARLDINRGAIRALRVKTRLAWLRDGAPITDTDLSRYTVQENDIGNGLAVRIDLIDMKGRILHSRRSDETQLVMMMEHPPVITDLAVAGEGKSGEVTCSQLCLQG